MVVQSPATGVRQTGRKGHRFGRSGRDCRTWPGCACTCPRSRQVPGGTNRNSTSRPTEGGKPLVDIPDVLVSYAFGGGARLRRSRGPDHRRRCPRGPKATSRSGATLRTVRCRRSSRRQISGRPRRSRLPVQGKVGLQGDVHRKHVCHKPDPPGSLRDRSVLARWFLCSAAFSSPSIRCAAVPVRVHRYAHEDLSGSGAGRIRSRVPEDLGRGCKKTGERCIVKPVSDDRLDVRPDSLCEGAEVFRSEIRSGVATAQFG